MNLMFAPLEKFSELEGRARRAEYWRFLLFQVLLFGGIATLGGAAHLLAGPGRTSPVAAARLLIFGLAIVAMIVPTMSLTVRRLHDIDVTGWWALPALIPGVGLLILPFALREGTAGENRFGSDPKAAGATLPSPD